MKYYAQSLFLSFLFVFNFETFAGNLKKYCTKLDKKFYKLGWKKSGCATDRWEIFGDSVLGDPLIYKTYPLNKKIKLKQITLIFCGVHGDEITPIRFCFDIINDLNLLIDKKTGAWKHKAFFGSRVVVAPLVNPDSFLKKWPTRTNANKVDINRNLPTKDFKKLAHKMWINRYKKNKRKYPGVTSNSEPETKFQVYLIDKFSPTKILSIHAPLTMIDYDGPDSYSSGGVIGKKANQLLVSMSEEAKGYRIMNYPFFPGSLGNYAGNERDIPTYTIELPSSDNRKAKKFWKLFNMSIRSAIAANFKNDGEFAFKKDRDSTSSN